jgi:hypothetical protein
MAALAALEPLTQLIGETGRHVLLSALAGAGLGALIGIVLALVMAGLIRWSIPAHRVFGCLWAVGLGLFIVGGLAYAGLWLRGGNAARGEVEQGLLLERATITAALCVETRPGESRETAARRLSGLLQSGSVDADALRRSLTTALAGSRAHFLRPGVVDSTVNKMAENLKSLRGASPSALLAVAAGPTALAGLSAADSERITTLLGSTRAVRRQASSLVRLTFVPHVLGGVGVALLPAALSLLTGVVLRVSSRSRRYGESEAGKVSDR